MKRRIATVFCVAGLLWAGRAVADAAPPAGEAYRQAATLGADGTAATVAENPESSAALAGLGMDGSGLSRGSVVVDPSGRTKKGSALRAESPAAVPAKKEPPSPDGAPAEKKPFLPKWAVYGGAALLGGLSGFFSGGPLGAVAGALGGLASAHFFQKGNYGASFGITAGMIVGAAIGGPIGGLLGAVVGGLLGHFIGKLFG